MASATSHALTSLVESLPERSGSTSKSIPKKRFEVAGTGAETVSWQRSLDAYSTLTAFAFKSAEGLHQAIARFYDSGELLNAPFESVDDRTLIVPLEAEPILTNWLAKSKIAYTSSRVLESREVPPAAMAKLRRKHKPGL